LLGLFIIVLLEKLRAYREKYKSISRYLIEILCAKNQKYIDAGSLVVYSKSGTQPFFCRLLVFDKNIN